MLEESLQTKTHSETKRATGAENSLSLSFLFAPLGTRINLSAETKAVIAKARLEKELSAAKSQARI